jgi:streptogramin lyase
MGVTLAREPSGSRTSTTPRLRASTPKPAKSSGEPIALEGQPVAVATGDGGVWVANMAGAVIWIDAESNEAEEPISLGGSPQSRAFGDGALWVADLLRGTVTRIEP